jgi:hypothetical protein
MLWKNSVRATLMLAHTRSQPALEVQVLRASNEVRSTAKQWRLGGVMGDRRIIFISLAE